MRTDPAQMAALAALASAPSGLAPAELLDVLSDAGIDTTQALEACQVLLDAGEVVVQRGTFELSAAGARALLAIHAAIERALDPSPSTPGMEECPSIPWLTTVQTCWVDAVSFNFAVAPDALRPLIPPPLEPEIFHGSAWVQVLISRLRDMRPQGTLPGTAATAGVPCAASAGSPPAPPAAPNPTLQLFRRYPAFLRLSPRRVGQPGIDGF